MPFLAALAIAILASGCVPDVGIDPEQCRQPAIRIELRLTSDGMEPVDPAVCRDQEVTLAVASEVDGILHIHGYDAELPASPITSGHTAELTFDATQSGQFAIELHPAGDPAGVGLGILTVHEP
jgi:hypothetical protein